MPRVEVLASRDRRRTDELHAGTALGAFGNLRLTAAGVYADYLLSGVPFIFLSEEWQNTVAADHAELWRALPSGALLSGLTVPVPTRERGPREMLHAHPAAARRGHRIDPDAPRRGCGTAACGSRAVGAHRPRRRIYWLSIPLRTRQRRAPQPALAATLDAIRGRDKDTDAALDRLPRPAAEGVRRAARRVLSRNRLLPNRSGGTGTTPPAAASGRHPLPATPYDPHGRLPGSAFTPVHSIPPPHELRGRRWRAARTDADVFVRTYRDPDDGVRRLVSGAGRRWTASPTPGSPGRAPPSSRCSTTSATPDTTLDWTIHITFAAAEHRGVGRAERHHQHPRPVPPARPPRRQRRRTGPQAGLGQGIGLRTQTRRRRTRRQRRHRDRRRGNGSRRGRRRHHHA